MDNEFNITYITLSGFVEMNKYRYSYFTVMFTVYIIIICSNSVIVYLIWSNKSLHEPMYIFIAALLFNSILYSTTVYPKLLIDFLSERQIVSYSACIFQSFLFYSEGGSEFILLAVMAFDRYVSLCEPLRYQTIMTKTTVNICLIIAWLFPVCNVAIQAILSSEAKLCNLNLDGIFCNNALTKLHCVRSRSGIIIGLVILTDVAIVPMTFTVFTYAKIFIISYQSHKNFRKKAAKTCIPHLVVLMSFFCLAASDVIITRVESDFSKPVRFIMTLQIFLYHPLLNPIIYGLKMTEISNHLKILISTKVRLCNVLK